MSNTTSTRIIPIDQIFALFKNSNVITTLYFWGYLFIFLFGFLGDIGSLLTFLRPTLRNISTGFLFIVLTISDTIYLLVTVVDFVEFGLGIQLYRKIAYDQFCRFRTFLTNISQLNSAWILVFISIDRWYRTRFPYKSVSVCTIKNSLIIVLIVLIISIGLNSHTLIPSFGAFIPGIASVACGPNLYTNLEYIQWYFSQWGLIQISLNCLIPATFMVLTLFDIIFNIGNRRQTAFRQNQRLDSQTKNLQKQIFLLLSTRITIFLATTLPVYVFRITTPRQLTFNALTPTMLTNVAALTWNSSLNFAVNFYMQCLTSRLFRDEFISQMKFLLCRHHRTTPIVSIRTVNMT